MGLFLDPRITRAEETLNFGFAKIIWVLAIIESYVGQYLCAVAIDAGAAVMVVVHNLTHLAHQTFGLRHIYRALGNPVLSFCHNNPIIKIGLTWQRMVKCCQSAGILNNR